MIEPRSVELRLAGADVHGTARALNDRDRPTEVRDALTIYRRVFPRVRIAEQSVVMVCIELDGPAIPARN